MTNVNKIEILKVCSSWERKFGKPDFLWIFLVKINLFGVHLFDHSL